MQERTVATRVRRTAILRDMEDVIMNSGSSNDSAPETQEKFKSINALEDYTKRVPLVSVTVTWAPH